MILMKQKKKNLQLESLESPRIHYSIPRLPLKKKAGKITKMNSITALYQLTMKTYRQVKSLF